MADVLSLKDGRVETVFAFRDFADLVECFMGYEARRYLEQWIDDNQSDTNAMDKEITELRSDLDELRDAQHEVLVNVRDDADALLDLLAEPRMNRDKLRTAAKEIYRIVDNEL